MRESPPADGVFVLEEDVPVAYSLRIFRLSFVFLVVEIFLLCDMFVFLVYDVPTVILILLALAFFIL